MNLRISPERLLRDLVGSVAVLAVLYMITRYLTLFIFEHPTWIRVLNLFNVDQEISIPTWYSQMLLAAAGLTALLISRLPELRSVKGAGYWFAIGVILLYMSIDEGSSIHEIATGPMKRALGADGTLFHHAWTVLGLAAVVIVVLALFRFWWRLPKKSRLLMAAAAGIYVMGAVGFEMIGGYVSANISVGMKYSAVVVFEESFEMLGAVLALYAFLDYWRHVAATITIELMSPPT